MLESCEGVLEICADGECVLLKIFLGDYVQNGAACCAADWVSSEGVEITALSQYFRDSWSCYHCS